MKWEVVKIKNEQKGSGSPFASVGNGRINISAAATKMVKNSDKYTYAELLKSKVYGKTYIGIRLLTDDERTGDALPIKRKVQNGKAITGMEISNKPVIQALFGNVGVAKKVTRFNVQPDDTEENILVIPIE